MMNGQQLKNSILQLAIQGKLVPQDSNDEPASALLSRIREEKKKLVEEKKIKKDKPLAPIKDEEKPFEIPESWEWVRLGEVTSIYGGKRIPVGSKLVDYNTGHTYIRVADMKFNTVLTNNLKYVPEEVYKKIKQYVINKDDLYITVAGTIGDIGEVPDILDGANLTENADKIVFRHIYKRYLLFALLSKMVQNQIKQSTTKVGQPKLAIIRIQNLVFPLPPLAEQYRIVEKIEELLPLVEEYDEAQTKLDKLNNELPEKLKKSVLQQAIMGRLDTRNDKDEPASALLARIREEKKKLVEEKKIKKDKPLAPIKDEEKPFDIPESWEWVRLGDICYLSDGEKAVGRKIVLDAKFLRKKHEGLNSNSGKLIKKGDYIILVDGENSGEVFKCPCNGYMGSTFKELIINNTIYKEYILVIMMYYKDLFRNSKKGSAIPHLNKDLFSNLTITLPPLAEQHRIVERIEELLIMIEALKLI